MIAGARLGLAHALHHWRRTMLMGLCVAVAVAVPTATGRVFTSFRERLLERAASTPLVIGAKGSRFDLVMALLYFRQTRVTLISMAEARQIGEMGLGVSIPMNVAHTARGVPVVAVGAEYFEQRGLMALEGSPPLTIGDAAVGTGARRALGLPEQAVGQVIFSDQRDLYDISKPGALKMPVRGVLAHAHSPDDDVIFVDINTAWILEGLSHGHADATGKGPIGSEKLAPELVQERTPTNVVVGEALIDYNEVTPANIRTFHLHAGETALPITGMVVFPPDQRALTMLKARVNETKSMQACEPTEVVEEMLQYVVRVRRMIDVVGVLLGVLAAAMIALVTALSVRYRSGEIESLRRIGASPGTVIAVFAVEVFAVVVGGSFVAVAVVWALASAAPDFVKFL